MPSALIIAAVVGVILIGVLLVVELIVVTTLLMVVKKLVAEIREHLDPLVAKANTLLITANEMAETVQDRTEHIAEQAAHTTSVVGNRVETASRLVQRLIAMPIINGSAAVAGVRRGIGIWRRLRRARRQGGITA